MAVVVSVAAAAGSNLPARSLLLLFCLAGCRSENAPPVPGEGFSADTGSVIVSAAQLAPGDITSLVQMMRLTMSEIDAALDGMTRRDTVLAGATEATSRRLTLWLQHDAPRKLVITEPNEAGEMTEESSFWFVNDELRVAVRPFDGYFLEGDRILLWTDGTLVPHQEQAPDETRMAEESVLTEEVRGWLRVFGITAP